LLAPQPNLKLEDHLLWAVRDCLFNKLATTLHTGGRSSIRHLRTRHAMVTGTHLSLMFLLPLVITYVSGGWLADVGCSVTENSRPFLRHSTQYIPPHIFSGRRKQMHFAKYCCLFRILYGPGQLSRYSDWLRAGRSGDRIPVGARFFAHVQNGPGVHPASCTMGTGSFLGVKRPGRDADHTSPSSAEVTKG
jgi:hypothetical protein